jgi:hypothetical protein
LLDQSAAKGSKNPTLPSPEFSPEVLVAASALETELQAAAFPSSDEWSGEVDPGHVFFDQLRMIAEAGVSVPNKKNHTLSDAKLSEKTSEL